MYRFRVCRFRVSGLGFFIPFAFFVGFLVPCYLLQYPAPPPPPPPPPKKKKKKKRVPLLEDGYWGDLKATSPLGISIFWFIVNPRGY